MATPNSQLEVALAQFAAQSGTTPDQEAQLRAAIVAEANLLKQFNQEAAVGQLKGFALETPGGAPNLTGTYDKQAGVVTLPVASFQPGGTVASNDLKAVVGLQAMAMDLAHTTYRDAANQTRTVSQDMVSNLQSTLNGSPVLAEQIKEAVTQRHVQHFGLLDGTMAAGATYDGNTSTMDGTPRGINLPTLGLQTNSTANPQGRFDAIDMTFVLGHEIQHGFNDAIKDQATHAFMRDIAAQARVQGAVHDYTDELRDYIQAGREDEAKAEIAGWNALLSRERQFGPTKKGLELMADTHSRRTLDFIERDPATLAIHIKPGLTFNQDGSLSQTPANIAAMGQHYFNRPSPNYAQPGQRPVGLGEHKPYPTADYVNYYGTWAVEQIVAAEDRANMRYQGAKPQIAIDMSGLDLKEDLIEMEGLALGGNKTSRPYLDTSQIPATSRHFDHTQDASMGHDHQYVPVAPSSPSLSALGCRGPSDPDHPDHPNHTMLEQIREGVRKIDEGIGKPYDDISERMSHCLLAECRESGLRRVDHVVMGLNRTNLFAVEGALTDPAHARTHVPMEQAIHTPVEQSDERLFAVNQAIAQQQELTRQQELARGPEEQTRSGQVMRM